MADYGIRKYRLRSALLGRGLLDGFVLDGDTLRSDGSKQHTASIFLPALDSAVRDCEWGRISLRCQLGPESILTIRAFASDQNLVRRGDEVVRIDDLLLDPMVSKREKERMFSLADGIERSGTQDVLLHGQNGRWLWLWLEVSGDAASILEDIRVYVPGDNFFRTFPQVYQTDNDFLRRYISVFSTMFQEFQEEILSLPQILDVDTAPSALLPVFASWLGLETDETLFTSDELRVLLKVAPELMARKGTRWAVENAVRLFVPETVYIVERNVISDNLGRGVELYGSTPYDFTVMVGRQMDEKLRLRLMFLINQFKPVRSRYNIVFLEECGGLDAFTYLDINGAVNQAAPGTLNDGKALTGMTYLQ